MKIEIHIGIPYIEHVPCGQDEWGNIQYMEEIDYQYEHEGYYETIDDAIGALMALKQQENKEEIYLYDTN